MMKVRTWYVYATDVLGYLDPKFKLIVGIARKSTYLKLKEVEKFFLCPKDTTRHKINIYKSIYHPLYYRKNELVLPRNKVKINSCGKVVRGFILNPENERDLKFIKILGPFIQWTLKHIIEYAKGIKVYQEGMKFGEIAVFILRVYRLNLPFIYYREIKPRVSNQFFNIEITNENILNDIYPIIPDEEFKELLFLIDKLHSYIFKT
ncbi:MAG: hypothetical protein ACTSRP_03525 [Candidatus Helarchaeota archaeon]